MSKCLTVGGHYWLDVGQYCHDEKWVCVTLGEILINDKKGIHAQILSVASVHRLKQSPEKWAWAYHWFHSKKKRKIISREDVRRRTTIGRDYFCAYRTKVVFLKKKDVFFFAKFEQQGKGASRERDSKKQVAMFWMSAANPYGASPGLSQADTVVPEQVILSMSKSTPHITHNRTILNWKLSTNWSVNLFLFLRRVCVSCVPFLWLSRKS